MAEDTEKFAVLLGELDLSNPQKELVENSNLMKYIKKEGFKPEKELREWRKFYLFQLLLLIIIIIYN